MMKFHQNHALNYSALHIYERIGREQDDI